MNHPSSVKFDLGQTVGTPSTLEVVHSEDLIRSLGRHSQGDGGDCGEQARQENDRSLIEGFRLFSVYHDRNGTKFWIITEADRSSTTILLPEEY